MNKESLNFRQYIKSVKEELKKNFPDTSIIFSHKKDKYGRTLKFMWNNGPQIKEVEKVVLNISNLFKFDPAKEFRNKRESISLYN